METPAGRTLPAGLVPIGMPRLLAAVSASSRSQVGPPKRLVTESVVPPATASRSIIPMVARRSRSFMVRA
jgi:hypothetical protein